MPRKEYVLNICEPLFIITVTTTTISRCLLFSMQPFLHVIPVKYSSRGIPELNVILGVFFWSHLSLWHSRKHIDLQSSMGVIYYGDHFLLALIYSPLKSKENEFLNFGLYFITGSSALEVGSCGFWNISSKTQVWHLFTWHFFVFFVLHTFLNTELCAAVDPVPQTHSCLRWRSSLWIVSSVGQRSSWVGPGDVWGLL